MRVRMRQHTLTYEVPATASSSSLDALLDDAENLVTSLIELVRAKSSRIPTASAYVSIRQHTSAYVSIRQHALSPRVSPLPQHTSAYVSMR
jgi:hypothetical protein